MIWRLSNFRAGDVVEVRSKEEILSSLDQHGCVDGMPFMPEMLQYCGRRFHVGTVAHKSCDTVRKTWKNRRVPSTVHLEGVRCDGSAHGGCQAECNLFWKDVWLKPAGANGSTSYKKATGVTTERPPMCTEAKLAAHARTEPDGDAAGPRYSCQATMLYEATEPLPWWDLRQYVFDVITGNHSSVRVLSALLLASLRWLVRRTPYGYRVMKLLSDRMHQRLMGRPGPSVEGRIQQGASTPTGRLDLQPGEYVRIKSKTEIEQTLDETAKNRGMFFDWEMIPYCERVFKVRSRVSKIIDEPTGKMLHMKQPCIVLDGVVCTSQYNSSRLMCPRAITPYWRELWLERVEDHHLISGEPPTVKGHR
jgi:hypothetical protein